jgi:hypothetical protein
MDRQVLADRIVTYSDTVVAFALVNGFAFLITLGEPDIRCSIADVSYVAFAMNVLFPLVSTYALFWLRGYEQRLRATPERVSDAESNLAGGAAEAGVETPIVEDELVSHFWRIAFSIRLVLIWLFGLIVIIGIYGATQDGRCAGISG